MSVRALAEKVRMLKLEAHKNPMGFVRLTRPQLEFAQSTHKYTLLRGGNQIGKTFVGSCEVIWRCLGTHPYKSTPTPPIEAWVVCYSWSQSIAVQEKLYNLLPKGEIAKDCVYVRGKGFRGINPMVKLKNGSIIRFKTTQQSSQKGGTVALSAASVPLIWIDEPCEAHIWGELVSRGLRVRGSAIIITMTPVGVNVDYLKKMVESGQVYEVHAPLNLDTVTPIGLPPLLDQATIDRQESSYLRFDRDCRMLGSWEGFTPDGLIFDNFRDELIHDIDPPAGEWRMFVGIDHGSQVGAQFAVLVAIRIPNPRLPHDAENNQYYAYIMDEYEGSGSTGEIHARAMLAMLRRHGLKHSDIHRWTGDIAHGGSKRYGGRMSNTMLRAAFEHVLKYPKGRGFRIHTAYKPSYSVYYGCRVIAEMQAKANFQINPRCKATIRSFKNWATLKSGRMAVDSPHKHAIDACRYAIMPAVDQAYRAPRQSKIKLMR